MCLSTIISICSALTAAIEIYQSNDSVNMLPYWAMLKDEGLDVEPNEFYIMDIVGFFN